MRSALSNFPKPVISTRDFITRNSVFKKFFKTELVLAQLDACNNLGPAGIDIIKEKEKIIFQQMSITAVALLRGFRDSSQAATDLIILEKPQPSLEKNAGLVHPYLDSTAMDYEKYLVIASKYLNSDALKNFTAEVANNTLSMKLYVYRDYYREAYALFEYCEILLKIINSDAKKIEADNYTVRAINTAAIAEEDIRIQEYVSQKTYEQIKSRLATQSIEEKKSHDYQLSSSEPFDVASRFFNTEILNYKAECNMKIAETDPIHAIQMHCESYTDIQLSALFLLKFIDFSADNWLSKAQSLETAATFARYYSEYKIPDAELCLDGANDTQAQTISLNLLPSGTSPIIINKIKLTLKFDHIIAHLAKILLSPDENKKQGYLQNLFDQTQDIFLTHSARYKEFYVDGLASTSNGNIIKPLDIPDSVANSHSKRLYPANPKPIRVLIDPTKLNQRINYLKSNATFIEFFNEQFVVSEIMSLRELHVEEAIDKEKLIYANIMLSAAYVLRYMNCATQGDLAKIFPNPPPVIFKLWEENPDQVDKMAVVMLNLPALEHQIDVKKRESTKAMLYQLRNHYRGAITLCQFTEILLRQFKGQTRATELEDFVFARMTLYELEEENKKIEMVSRQRDTQNRKGKNTKAKNAYREPEHVAATKINVTDDFFYKNKMESAINDILPNAIANNSVAEIQTRKIFTSSILSALFLMKLLNHLSENTILKNFYKTKMEETQYYFAAYHIPDAYFESAIKGQNPHLIIVQALDQTNICNIIKSSLNIEVISAEIIRILKLPSVAARNIEFKSLYDQAVKLFHNFDLHYKAKTIFAKVGSEADDLIIDAVHYRPVLALNSFPIPDFPVEVKKETKISKRDEQAEKKTLEDKPRIKNSDRRKDEKSPPKVLSATEITKNSIYKFLQEAKSSYADIPDLLAGAQNNFAELRRRNAKVAVSAELNASEPKLFKEISEVKSAIITIGESIDTLSEKHKDFVIPAVSTSELLSELETNKEILKQASTDLGKLFEKAKSLSTAIASLDDRINKVMQKLQHLESNALNTSANTATIKQKLQNRQEQKEAERKAAAELKKKIDDEKKSKQTKKKLTIPPSAPVVTLSPKKINLFSQPSAKEQKQTFMYNPMREKRLLYLDEACQSLIFINKILEHYSGLHIDVMHFSLLYNIFRCFFALKKYQECGGRESQELNVDIIKELRHMIIHHGGRAVDNAQVLAFAQDIRKQIPAALLKLKKPHLWKSELTTSQRDHLMEEFGIIPSGLEKLRYADPFAKVIDDTPFYKKLRQFHEARMDNKVGLEDQDLVLTIYIPLMKSIIESFKKQADYKTNVNLFLQCYLFELQALSMLAALCGEVSMGFPALDYKLTDFLSACYLIRNEVGHELYDFEKLTVYARTIENKISLVNERKLIEKKDEPVAVASAPSRRLG